MAYNGYRLKIGDTAIPNGYIAKGSYSVVPNQRVVGKWTDGNGVEHTSYYPNPKYVISFALRECDTTESATLFGLFQNNELTVNFWDDRTQTYRNGNFTVKISAFSHTNILGGKILYNTTKITLTER